MSHKFTRLELYELVWSEPLRKLGQRIGVSDVAIAKQRTLVLAYADDNGLSAPRDTITAGPQADLLLRIVACETNGRRYAT